MSKLKITKGEWTFKEFWKEKIIPAIIIRVGKYKQSITLPFSEWNTSGEEATANAQLICDAGNTSNKCGLLPSELLKQRNEMREILSDLMGTESTQDSNGNIVFRFTKDQVLKAEKAIKD